MFHKNIFTSEHECKLIKKFEWIVIAWYLADTILFFLIGVAENNIQTILAGAFLVFWFVLTSSLFTLLSKIKALGSNFHKLYLPTVFVLSLIEETLVFYNGGGLGGKATSLTQDLLLAVPVFLGIAFGILVLDKFTNLSSGEIFAIGSIQGFIIEIIISGNFYFAWLLGGPALGIYGMMMAALHKNESSIKTKRSNKQTFAILTTGTILCLTGAIIGAIIGDTFYSFIKS